MNQSSMLTPNVVGHTGLEPAITGATRRPTVGREPVCALIPTLQLHVCINGYVGSPVAPLDDLVSVQRSATCPRQRAMVSCFAGRKRRKIQRSR